jgi:hypothetical protein
MFYTEFETTVKGRLPVIAKVWIDDPDRTVGLMFPTVSDLEITFLSGHPIAFPIPAADEDRIIAQAFNDYEKYQASMRCIKRYGHAACLDT